MHDTLCKLIRQQSMPDIVRLMLEGDPPRIRRGWGTERELWDYKSDCPRISKESANAWAHLAGDVLAFHNQKGGLIFFGIDDAYQFSGATTRLDPKLINDQLRRYLGDRLWVEYYREFIQRDQRYLGILMIPPRGPALARFTADAPETNGGRQFTAGCSAIREGDSTRMLSREQADEMTRQLALAVYGKTYEVNEPYFRVLSPEYEDFIERAEPCTAIDVALGDPRSSVAAIVGIGGVGKTALATWAVLRAYTRKQFQFIVSITAKDRELTLGGIKALEPALTTFEDLLDSILDVLGFSGDKILSIEEKAESVRALISGSNGLLFVDNLETIDDVRIVSFLDNLPQGVKAITTSRRSSVRVSVHPVDLGPLTEPESVQFLESIGKKSGVTHLADLPLQDKARIVAACDHIPLAIRWLVLRSKSGREVVALAEGMLSSRQTAEQLLEFCFRRVFDSMKPMERNALQVLSLFQRAIPTEVIQVGAAQADYVISDVVADLVDDALIRPIFDPERNDYGYTLLPIVRAFVYQQVDMNAERAIRQRLSNWYEAKDIQDLDERLVVRELRQGRKGSDAPLIDLARNAESRGDLDSAESLLRQALQRNPRSWRAAWLCAEVVRKRGNSGEALRLYQQAAATVPNSEPDRSVINREWGMLLRSEGAAESTDMAISALETSLSITPHDVYAAHALAQMYDRKGQYRKVIELVGRLEDHPLVKTRTLVLPLLVRAHRKLGNMVKTAELQSKLNQLP